MPTHFTEHSSSLIDIILTNNENHLLYTKEGVICYIPKKEILFLSKKFDTTVLILAFLTLLNLNANHISAIPGHTTEVIITLLEKMQIGEEYTIKTLPNTKRTSHNISFIYQRLAFLTD